MSEFQNIELTVETRSEALALARQTLSSNPVISNYRSEMVQSNSISNIILEYVLSEVFYILSKRFSVINYSYCAISWIRCGMEEVVHAFELDTTCPNFLSRENKEQLNSANRLLEMAFYDVNLEPGPHNLATGLLGDIFKNKDFIKNHLQYAPEMKYDEIIKLAKSIPNKRQEDHPDYLSMEDIHSLSKDFESSSSEQIE